MKESYLAADFRKTVAQRFAAQEKELNATSDARLQADRGTWRVDMTKCPYYDTCVQYGCPELCPCFCDSDDITCANLTRSFSGIGRERWAGATPAAISACGSKNR